MYHKHDWGDVKIIMFDVLACPFAYIHIQQVGGKEHVIKENM